MRLNKKISLIRFYDDYELRQQGTELSASIPLAYRGQVIMYGETEVACLLSIIICIIRINPKLGL